MAKIPLREKDLYKHAIDICNIFVYAKDGQWKDS